MTLDGGAALALIAHGDVEPADAKTWRTPPFAAVLQDDKLFGRGAEDDKGPLAAAMVAVAAAHAFGLKTAGIRISVGTSEETSAEPMKRYAAQPQAKLNVSIDAEFPVVAAQLGFVAWHLRVPLGVSAGPAIVRVEAGEFLTQIPGHALALITRGAAFAGALRERAQRLHVRATVTATGDDLTVAVEGKTAHASVPEEGDNALIRLAMLMRELPVAKNGYKRMLDILADDFGDDMYGRTLGVAYEDPVMGKLIVAPTTVREVSGAVELGVNLRRPVGMSAEAFRAKLHAVALRLGADEGETFVGDAHAADVSGPLVTTLLGIYDAHEGVKAVAKTSRGGTYAKLFSGGVDFGPAFPSEPYTGHTDNEYITVRALGAETEMLGEAIIALALKP
jgi:predicted dipeptidase